MFRKSIIQKLFVCCLTVMLAVPFLMSPAKGEDLPEESGYQEEENLPEEQEFREEQELTEDEQFAVLGAAKAAAPDYTILKSGYSGYQVLETGFENYGTIGVFIPRKMMGQEIEYGADGGLEWIPESITYYTTDTKTSEPTTENVLAALIYRGAVDAGVTRIDGSAYILLKQRAYDVYGNKYDVRVDFTNFEFGQIINRAAGDSGVVISELYPDGRMYVSAFALGRAVSVAGDRVSGVAMDVDITVLDEYGNPLHEPTVFYMEDIDASDHVALADARKYGTTYIGGRYDTNGQPTSFLETVYIRSVVDEIYVSTDNVLNYTLQPGRFVGTELTSSIYTHPQKDAAILFETTTDNIHISWTGSQCATSLFTAARSYTITSEVVGNHPEGGTITNGGNGAIAVPYKMDYGLQIKAAPGFVPENVWVDGEQIDPDGVISGREGFYLFETVAASHTIDVSFVPMQKDIRITKISEESGQTLSGAEFTVYEWNGSEYQPVAEESASSSVLTESENGFYTGTVYYSVQNEGRFRIVETKAPDGYLTGYEAVFSIDPEGDAIQSFTDTAADSRHYVSITIVKNCPAADLYSEHGSADFVFRIDGIDRDGAEKTYYRIVSLSEEDADGAETVSKAAEVLYVPEGSYTVTELETSRFVLTDIEAGEGDFTAAKDEIRTTAAGVPVISGFAGGFLTADENVVWFSNRKERWDDFSHASSVVNHIGLYVD